MSKTPPVKPAVKFAQTILQLFPPFRWEPDQEERWMEIMARETSGFSDAVLDRALSIMVRRKDHRMPTPGECINACIEAKRWAEKDKQASELTDLHPSAGLEWSTERKRLAYELCKGTTLGKEAAKDGWVQAMWDFCRRHQRLPVGHEIEACKRGAKEFMETYKLCLRGECIDRDGVVQKLGSAEAAVLQKLGSSMLTKREKLSQEVLGR